jgi:hypothetical protein
MIYALRAANPSGRPVGRPGGFATLRPFRGWPALRASGLRPSSIPLDTPRHTFLLTACFALSLDSLPSYETPLQSCPPLQGQFQGQADDLRK